MWLVCPLDGQLPQPGGEIRGEIRGRLAGD